MTQEANITVTRPENAVTPINQVRAALEKMKPEFAKALPKHITPERMLRVAMTAVQNTPKLLDCDKTSLYSAIMRSAQLGLEPDGILGQAYLIPFNKKFNDNGTWKSKLEVQFIVGYRGLIDLARRSGDVSNIIAKEVYANDIFDVDWSQDMPFTHKPCMSGERGEVTHFWALAKFKDGGFHWDYMSKQEVEAIRDKGNRNPVWEQYFIEMGKKTVIRRIAKYLPMSVQRAAITEELSEAGKSFTIDNDGEIIVSQESIVIDEKLTGTEKLKEVLQKKADIKTIETEVAAQNQEASQAKIDDIIENSENGQDLADKVVKAVVADIVALPQELGSSQKAKAQAIIEAIAGGLDKIELIESMGDKWQALLDGLSKNGQGELKRKLIGA